MTKEPYDLMDLKALRCFEAMARHGSLLRSKSSRACSTPLVSRLYRPGSARWTRRRLRCVGPS